MTRTGRSKYWTEQYKIEQYNTRQNSITTLEKVQLAIRTNELTVLKGSKVKDTGEYLSIKRKR
ncbi:hypothetical protein MTR_7g116290 [Medicago truncatula]|uniref:Uncharacterized protein n=1 Tax=Medicago truncatula TaxID=3880 RepID=G7L2W6_MEDTR|nr:hypothetical protein MTR_7g116290 [Medicago truncatula]